MVAALMLVVTMLMAPVSATVAWAMPGRPLTIAYDAQWIDEWVEGAMDNQVIEAGGSAALSTNAFSRAGYHFVGWNTAFDGSGTSYADGETVYADNVEGELLLLYAQWEPNTCTLTFNPAGGTVGVTSLECTYGGRVSYPEPTWLGHTFLGWAKDDNPNVVVSGDTLVPTTIDGGVVSFTALWQAQPIVISYEPNYPSGFGATPEHITVEYGMTTLWLPPLSNDGFVFEGWMTRDGRVLAAGEYLSSEVLGGTAADTTLYGVWRRNAYTLSYDLQGGQFELDGVKTSTPDPDVIEVGSYVMVPNPTRAGYLFVGWYDSNGNFYAPDSTMKELATDDGAQVTLTALWEVDPKQAQPKQTANAHAQESDGKKQDDQSQQKDDAQKDKSKEASSNETTEHTGVATTVSTVPSGPFEDVLPPVEEIVDDTRYEVIFVMLGAIVAGVALVAIMRLLDSLFAKKGETKR